MSLDLDSFLTSTYIPLRLRGRSPNSVRLLRHAVRQFSKFLGRPATLDDLEDLTVAQFLTARAATLAPHSVARERSGIIALWNLAQARGLIRLRPSLSPDVLPMQTPRAFTGDELRRLEDSAGLATGWIGPVPARIFWRALVGTLLESGERIGAILAAPAGSWRRPWFTVPAIVRKGGRVERIYELSPETSDLVDAATAHEGPTAFYFPASTTALYKRWHVITRRAGLGEGRQVQFHALRRSTASHLDAAGADATAYLGHSSDRITRRSYLDPRITEANKVRACDIIRRALRRDDDLPPPAVTRPA